MDNDFRHGNEVMQEVEVDFKRLDDVLQASGINQIDYLSVTVNGAEAEVLKGTEMILRNSRPGTRVYAKGHAIGENGDPINIEISELLRSYGYDPMISKGEKSSSDDGVWNVRAGDVFAWKA